MKFDPRRIVIRMTGAYVWRGASTIDAVEIANRLAEIDWLFIED